MSLALDRAGVEHVPDPNDRNSSTKNTSADNFHETSSLKHRLSVKVKTALHIHHKPQPADELEGLTLAPLPQDTEVLRLDEKKPPDAGEKFHEFVKHPVHTIVGAVKAKGGAGITENLVNKEISHTHDVELIKAADKVAKLEDGEPGKEEAKELVEELKKSRQDMFTRWALDRHVMKIRRLEENIRLPPRRGDFIIHRVHPNKDSVDWVRYGQNLFLYNAHKYGPQYIGAYLEPEALDQKVISAAAERLIVASAPFQTAFLEFRHIYLWEDTAHTLQCLAAFLILWAFDFLLVAALVILVGSTLQRRTKTPGVEELRKKLIRTENEEAESLDLLEFIEKHGDDWPQELIKKLGPFLLIQLADIASLMEVMLSFYEWRNPERTAIAVGVLAAGAVVVLFTPVWLLVKATTLSVGLMIFFLWPVSSRYPEYRFFVSPAKWLFWNIPDHPEWALARLRVEGNAQTQAVLQRQKVVHGNSTVPGTLNTGPRAEMDVTITSANSTSVEAIDLVKYSAAYKSHQGKLIIGNTNIKLESAIRGKEMWMIPYNHLKRIEKVRRSTRMRSGDDLLFVDVDGNEFTADDMTKRDEVFAQIIGYSGIDWQVIG